MQHVSGPFEVQYSLVTDSTQTFAKAMLDGGAKAPVVALTEEQTAGRGRLDRAWTAPRFSSVLMSVGLPLAEQQSNFTLQVGVVIARAFAVSGVDVRLKWPNDIVVLRDGGVRKLGGVLAEVHGAHVVVGIGLNIDLADDELPTPDAISCRQLGAAPRRERIIHDIVEGLSALPQGIVIDDYRALCATLGADIRVTRITGETLQGKAISVDDEGALVVRDGEGREHRVTVGDVQHVRPEGRS